MRMKGTDDPVLVLKVLQWGWSGGDEPARGKRWSPGNWEEPGFFLRRLETVRSQEDGWQEPYEPKGSRTVVCPAKAGMFSGS